MSKNFNHEENPPNQDKNKCPHYSSVGAESQQGDWLTSNPKRVTLENQSDRRSIQFTKGAGRE